MATSTDVKTQRLPDKDSTDRRIAYLPPRLRWAADAVRVTLREPADGLDRARIRAGYLVRGRPQRHEYRLESAWQERLHERLGLAWPCSATRDFEQLWLEIVDGLREQGLSVGRGSYGGSNDTDPGFARAIWCLTTHLQPEKVVETGVARRITSRVILEALERTGTGHLWSIGSPAMDPTAQDETGVAVPERLRARWSYVCGTSRRRLPNLLTQIEPIGLFVNGSSNSERNVRFELNQAWNALCGGAVIVDDVQQSAGFAAFTSALPERASFVAKADDAGALFGIALKAHRVQGGVADFCQEGLRYVSGDRLSPDPQHGGAISSRTASQDRLRSVTPTSVPPNPVVKEGFPASLLASLDLFLEDRVLVFGSLPPEGRDVDILARSAQFGALAEWLDSQGFERREDRWVRFAHGGVAAVDLVHVDEWGLSEREVEDLFAQGVPLPGLANLVRPSAAHTLLILARRRGWQRRLSAKHLAAIEAAVAANANAWSRAREHAREWLVESSLTGLQATWIGKPLGRRSRVRTIGEALALRGGGSSAVGAWAVIRRRAIPFRRGVLVALSGVDGAGKSSQAVVLHDNLRMLGYDAVVQWSPLGANPSVIRIGGWGKRLPTRRSDLRRRPALSGSAGIQAMDRSAVPAGPGGVVQAAWVTFLGLASIPGQMQTALHLLRGRVVICDRYSLDSAVHLQHRYGDTRTVRLQLSLISLVSPRPRVHYLLEVRPEVALRRKVDRWSTDQLARRSQLYRALHETYGAQRVDGERPPRDLATQIGHEVWRALT